VVGGAVVYDSGKNELFVATGATNSTSIISDATNSVFAKVAAGPSPYALAYDPGRGEIFVANYDASTVTILYDTTPTPPTGTSGSGIGGYLLWILLLLILLAVIAYVLWRRSKKAPVSARTKQ
jgi:YVTN family beta-propeller protein